MSKGDNLPPKEFGTSGEELTNHKYGSNRFPPWDNFFPLRLLALGAWPQNNTDHCVLGLDQREPLANEGALHVWGAIFVPGGIGLVSALLL